MNKKIKYDFKTEQEAIEFYYEDGQLGKNDCSDRLERWLSEQLIEENE